ncbi:MAG TPA: helix-turn-helix domain-containing protein [Candidatus Onthocola gallistercoris]|uniref:Helix-turn-helix domain-containing protein n=1 Tax=Candidatus Onthocola gallistercoris TaxID=2840876 RepID=A0A9D1HG24_9FIRM|nr:helix-turn-helix domain-containing protein [Candidatus Onthocola gallistercoris]
MIIEEHRMTQLGYALREYRVRHNMTQQDLAEQLGVSTNTIHLWETRVCKPSMGSLLLLSDLLDMPLLDIISKSKQRF